METHKETDSNKHTKHTWTQRDAQIHTDINMEGLTPRHTDKCGHNMYIYRHTWTHTDAHGNTHARIEKHGHTQKIVHTQTNKDTNGKTYKHKNNYT